MGVASSYSPYQGRLNSTPKMKADPELYINRELSWLEFNQRVLDEAANPSVPLLERVRFLAITASNLDEFFMVRVGSLRTAIRRGDTGIDPSGMAADEQLQSVSDRIHRMVEDQYRIYLDELEPAMNKIGIRRRHITELTQQQSLLSNSCSTNR